MGEFLFGRYRLIPDRRALIVDGREIPVRSRPFDILVTLVEGRDRVVSKDELLERVWPGRIVEEGNLTVHIAGLRKLLGSGIIATLPGRGYRFVAPVQEVLSPASPGTPAEPADLEPARNQSKEPPTNLPASVSRLIGRDAALADVTSMLEAHRLVTLIGPGGIGKTRLALEVARHLSSQCADGVWLVDLGPLSDGALVMSAVASALGINASERGAMLDRIATALRSRVLLLVLDNCEHLLGPSATMAETVAQAGVGLRVLATSREPLKVEGEWLYHVPPLTIPREDERDTEEILNHSAVELFMSRTATAEPRFRDSGANVEVVGSICRHLDGIPLAIELAAARAATLGIEPLADRLGDRFRLLTEGRRTALPRHQTLRATLDWSYALLTDLEQVVLRRLGIFFSFDLNAALRVAEVDGVPAAEMTDVIGGLVEKSLVTVEMSSETTRYRLLETTRAYALEKLSESGKSALAARRHAEFYRDLFAPSEPVADLRPTIQRINLNRRELDNVRAALDWAFSSVGDTTIGVALTASYVPVWLYWSFVGECRERAERALNSLRPDSDLSEHLRIQLYTTLGIALVYTTGVVERTAAILSKGLEIAESLDDVDWQLQVLWAMWICRFNNGENRAARSLADRFLQTATRAADPVHIADGDRLLGSTLHYEGDQAEARRLLERAAEFKNSSNVQRHLIWLHSDHSVMAQARLARVLMLQGLIEQAETMGRAALTAAQRIDHKLSICFALGEAVCPLALMTGDLAAAELSLRMLKDVASRHNFNFWTRLASCLEGSLLIRRGNLVNGTSLLRTGLDAFIRSGQRLYNSGFVTDLARGLAASGYADEAAPIIDDALSRSDADGVRWHVAELFCAKGELMLQSAKDEALAAADRCFACAIEEASRQGALFSELRGAVGLANLRIRQSRREDARQLLAPVYGRFTEGFEAADLIAARAILR